MTTRPPLRSRLAYLIPGRKKALRDRLCTAIIARVLDSDTAIGIYERETQIVFPRWLVAAGLRDSMARLEFWFAVIDAATAEIQRLRLERA